MKKINIAVWSIGEHSLKNVIPAIVKSSKVILLGLFTRNKTILDEQSKKYQCRKYSTSIKMLEDESIDCVYICSPNALHYKQAKLALSYDKHVIVEKKAFSSTKETRKILELATLKRCVVMEAFMFRFHKQFKALQKILNSKKYGEIFSIDANFGYPHLDKKNIRYSKKMDGGSLFDAGIYPISFIFFILGNNISLLASNIINEDGYEVDTSGFAIFKKDNVIASSKWVMGASYKNQVDIWCADGHICVDMAFSKNQAYISNIEVKNNGEVIEKIITGTDNHFTNMIDYFSDLIIDNSFRCEQNNLMSIAMTLEKIKRN